jgi:hypothetical protein
MSAPVEVTLRVVPPTLTTFGELEGHSTPAPLSPMAAKKTIPGLMVLLVKYESSALSVENSLPPQLIETAFTCGTPVWENVVA